MRCHATISSGCGCFGLRAWLACACPGPSLPAAASLAALDASLVDPDSVAPGLCLSFLFAVQERQHESRGRVVPVCCKPVVKHEA